MRQGQQNRRGRGRGRKPQNPLARNYESNGPDVKIRGTAAHIAEKYMSLARDALASGDMITAENYLQHAEHYNRIIMAAQAQMGQHQSHQGEPNGGYRPPQRFGSETDDDSEFEAGEGGAETRGPDMRGPDMRSGGDFRGGRDGGRDQRRHGGNGREDTRGDNGGESSDVAATDDTASDQVS